MTQRIAIFGGSGLVGKALEEIMPHAYYIKRSMADLTKQTDVENIITRIKPTMVVHLAAKVGGIESNMLNPADYFYENVMMNTNLVEACRKSGVERFMGILSTCVYPVLSNNDLYPLREESISSGEPEITNRSYAYAKRMMHEHCEAVNKQYGKKYSCLIPCNLYGIHDKYDPKNSHFVAALIRKIYEANKSGAKKITLFGNGKSLRQFMFADDFANVIKDCITKDINQTINVCPDEQYSIREIAEVALFATDSTHLKIEWDKKKPNGIFRKDACNKRMKELLPATTFTSLHDGIQKTYAHYKLQRDENHLS